MEMIIMRRDELYHYGVKGMKWRHHKSRIPGRKELGQEVLEPKYSYAEGGNVHNGLHIKNARSSYRTGTEYDNPDGSRSMRYHSWYRQAHAVVKKKRKPAPWKNG